LETLDPKQFLSTIHPFDYLTDYEREGVLENLDIHYFQKDEVIIAKDEAPEHYFIIAKGKVLESTVDDENISFAAKDSFDAKSLIRSKTESTFTALEETICFALSKAKFLELIQTNATFENYYVEDIAKKIQGLVNQRQNQENASVMLNQVKDGYMHDPIIIDAKASIFEAVKMMSEHKYNAILVDFGDDIGLVTDSDLRNKVILTRKSYDDPIGGIARKNLITIDQENYLFNAVLIMTENSIKRLVVRDKSNGNKVVGILEQMDVISGFSSKSHLINIKIDKARSIAEVKAASDDLIFQVKALQSQGVQVRHITKLLGELNAKLYKKVFELVAPKALIENSCLIVLGSEGRREQVLKTDQDNALIIRDGFVCENLQEITGNFTEALIELGFPPCPGNIMISNPYWSKSLDEHVKEVLNWIHSPDAESMMNLAIFFDARIVAGDVTLLKSLRDRTVAKVMDDRSFLAHFAKATLMFETPLSLFSNFVTEKDEHKDELDIKKGAIFSLVQGVRSLAFEAGVERTNTVARIKDLNNRGVINREMANELIESFNFLLTLRLQHQLECYDSGMPIDNYINPSKLAKHNRDLLRDVFKVVQKFKKFIEYHFKLGHLG